MMRFQTVFEKFQSIISEQIGVVIDEVTPQAKFVDDLGADELDTTELVTVLEEEFNIDISDEVINDTTTVQEAWNHLDGKVLSCPAPDFLQKPANSTMLSKDIKEIEELIESIANFWERLEIGEAEAIKLTEQCFKTIKRRKLEKIDAWKKRQILTKE